MQSYLHRGALSNPTSSEVRVNPVLCFHIPVSAKGRFWHIWAPTPPRVACEGLAWKQYASRHTSDFERQAPRAFKSNSLLFFFGLAIGSTISVPRTYLMLALLASDGASGPVAL